jgi:hypothetical protein
MANSKISALTSATTPLAGTETLPIVQSSTTKQVSVANLTAGRTVSCAALGLGGTPNELAIFNSTSAASYIQITNTGTGTTSGDGLFLGSFNAGAELKNKENAQLSFGTNNTTRMTISAGGDVTVETGNLSIATSGKGITTGSSIPLGFGVNGSTSQVTIDTGGRFLLGTTSATTGGVTMAAVLDARTVNSGFGLGVIGNASNTQIMRFAYDTTAVGSIVISNSGTTYNIISDQDLKTDLGVVTETDVIANTVIHDYTWKVDGTKARGVFAQEAHIVNPLAVSVGSDELDENGNKINPWQVDLSKYIPDIIVELQSLRKRVAELEAKG